MNRRYRETMLSVCRVALAALVIAVVPLAATPAGAAEPAVDVLVFTKTADSEHAHASTDDAVTLVEMTGRRYGLGINVTDDATAFNAKRLAEYDVVMWLNTSGDVLDDAQQRAFSDWIADGGGFVGVHSAARTETGWDYYHDLVGAFEVSGENVSVSEMDVTVDTDHPSTKTMPENWKEQNDQWYRFDRDPAKLPDMTILATVPQNGGDAEQPVAWARPFDGGRSWYTSMGHSTKTFEDGDFMKLLRGGIWWAADQAGQPVVRADSAAPAWPYGLSFIAWIAAVAAGGAIAVMKLNRSDGLV